MAIAGISMLSKAVEDWSARNAEAYVESSPISVVIVEIDIVRGDTIFTESRLRIVKEVCSSQVLGCSGD